MSAQNSLLHAPSAFILGMIVLDTTVSTPRLVSCSCGVVHECTEGALAELGSVSFVSARIRLQFADLIMQ
jgi:hypothetical protein